MVQITIRELADQSQKLDQLGQGATGYYLIRMLWKGMKRLFRYSVGPGGVTRLEIQEAEVGQLQGIFIHKVTKSNGWSAVTAKRQGERGEGREGWMQVQLATSCSFYKRKAKDT